MEANSRSSNDKGSQDKDQLIQELEEKVEYLEKNRLKVNEKLSQALDRLSKLRQEKVDLQLKLEKMEHKKLDFKLQEHGKLKQDYHKMSHRAQITKEQLDETRRELEFLNNVIKDLEERGIIDYIKKRYPSSFIQYKKNR